jgi:DNA-binding beta-propeller fold protein YncE
VPRLWILAGCLAALLGLNATPADAAVDATLRQIGCLSASALSGCTTSPGIAGAERPAFSPDGAHLYVPGRLDDTLVDYKRDAATGALARAGCRSIALAGCVAVAGLDEPSAAAVSPDGAYLYVVTTGLTDGKLFIFQRVGEDLSIPVCFSAEAAAGCTTSATVPRLAALAGANSVFARNDSVYVTGFYHNSVIGFRRLAGGAHEVINCVGAPPCDTGQDRFNNPTDIVVAPDGAHAYVSSYNTPDRLVALNRAADGTLAARADTPSCVAYAVVANCGKRPAGRETISLALSPDGRQLYASSRYQYGGGEAVELFDIPGDGSIVPRPGGCWNSSIAPALAGCTKAQGLENSIDVTLTPDGRAAFVGSLDGTDEASSADDGYVVSFARGADGMLTQQPAPYGCLATVARAGCGTLANGGAIRAVVASPDSRHLYAHGAPGDGGTARLLGFRIDRAPTCGPVSTSTPFNTAVLVQLSCNDADGDALSYETLTPPQRGFLGSFQADGTVPFAPLGGLSGADSFTYRATAAGISADPATATVDVQPPPSGGGGTIPPPVVERMLAVVRPFWVEYRRYVVLRRLRVSEIAAGAAVQLRCKGRGCPFKRKRFPVSNGRADASKAVKKGKLRRGTRIQVWITKPGAIGKVVIYTVPRRGLPKGRVRCLPPGATKPAAC